MPVKQHEWPRLKVPSRVLCRCMVREIGPSKCRAGHMDDEAWCKKQQQKQTNKQNKQKQGSMRHILITLGRVNPLCHHHFMDF